MKTRTVLGWAFAIAMAACSGALAQRMPQDSWYLEKAWSSAGTNTWLFVPRGCCTDSNGFIYIVNGFNQASFVQLFDGNGAFVRKWNVDGARDLAVGPDGNFYVVRQPSMSPHGISVFNPTGGLVRLWVSTGSGPAQFMAPEGIDVAPNGMVFVADTENDRVQVFDLNGTFIRMWGTHGTAPGEFDLPKGVAVGPDTFVYVAEYNNSRVQVFRQDGTFIRKFPVSSHPSAVAVGMDGLVVCNRSVYESDGTLVRSGIGEMAGVDVMSDGAIVTTAAYKAEFWRRSYRTFQSSTNALPQPRVSSAEQRAGTTYMDIDYIVHDTDSSNVTVGVLAFVDGANDLDRVLIPRTFVGNTATNLGPGIPANQQRRITWNAGADWSADFGEVEAEILAKDRPGLMDVHYITIPSNGPNPDLTISRSPITEDDMLHCWYWLLATNDSAVALSNGTLYEVSGTSSNAILCTKREWPAVTQTEVEPNKPMSSANALALSGGCAGVSGVLTVNDEDWYSFNVQDANTFVECRFRATGSPALAVGVITDGAGQWIAVQMGQNSEIALTCTVPAAGPYYVFVAQNGNASQTGTYNVAVSVGARIAAGTTARGRQLLWNRMGVREATAAEVRRASKGPDYATTNLWDPRTTVGPGDRPKKVNEYGFDTGAWGYPVDAWYVVPLP